MGVYQNKIDDDLTNVTALPALLHVFSGGNLRVILSDGSVEYLKNYMNDPKMLVSKVFKTDLTIPETDVRLYK